MGRKSKAAAPATHLEVPGCFNGIWNAATDPEDTPVVARKSLSERKFSEGFEAPRNSLDIGGAALENGRHSVAVPAASDEIPFGFEFALRKSMDKAPPRVSIPNAAAAAANADNRCRSPSVIARLMGLDALPAEQPLPDKDSSKQQQQSSKSRHSQAWTLLSDRRELLSSRSSKEQARESDKKHFFSRQLSGSNSKLQDWPLKTEYQNEDEFLLFDVLPFRDHPQEKQLEKLKQEFQAQRLRKSQMDEHMTLGKLLQLQRNAKISNSSTMPEKPSQLPVKRNPPAESRNMLDAIQFLQSNKEFLVKFLQEPNSVFARHIYDLQALAAKEAAAEAARSNSSKSKSVSKASKETIPHEDNLGFSRKLVDFRKDQEQHTRSHNLKKDAVQRQRKDNASRSQDTNKIILLKPNSTTRKQSSSSATSSRTMKSREIEDEANMKKSRSFKDLSPSTDPRELARQIAKQVRENVTKELQNSRVPSNTTSSPWSLDRLEVPEEVVGGEGSEPSSRRYTKDFQVHHSTASLPSSPRLTKNRTPPANVSSKEGRKQLIEKLKMAQTNPSDDESSKESSTGRKVVIQIEVTPSASLKQQEKGSAAAESKKNKGGKLLKLFSSREPAHAQKPASDDSPRLLVRSKSVPSFVEEKTPGAAAEILDRTHSCKQISQPASESTSNPKGKLSSLKSSLLGKKKSQSRPTSDVESTTTSRELGKSSSKEVEHFVQTDSEEDYVQAFREMESRSCEHYNSQKKVGFDAQSPRFLSVDITDHLDSSSDIHIEKSEQPSPVSVLERGFIEESPSPVSFEDVSSDLQELQIRLERLKLDESGRTWNARETVAAEEGFHFRQAIASPADIPRTPSCDSPQCSPTSHDHLYISKLIHASGLSNSLGSLFAWHSPSCPIDPFLFGKLEEEFTASEVPSLGTKRHGSRTQRKLKIGRTFTQVQRRPETLHRQMLFDVVNEVLSKKFHHLWEDHPWARKENQRIRPIPTGKFLLQEIGKEISLYHHEYDTCEYPLENLVERDVNRGDQWMDTSDELRQISTEMEEEIFNSLIEEVACSFIR